MTAAWWFLAGGLGAAGAFWWLRDQPSRRSPASADAPTGDASLPPRAGQSDFDHLFARLGRGIPVAYLRALAMAESGMNPDDPKGLINVVAVAVADYNRRHPSNPVTSSQLRDPAVSVTVAVDILRTIITSYATNHPDITNLREDWRNPRFVELLTAGWNAGFSERAGVGRVVRYLQSRGVTDITVDRVFDAAPAAGAASTLANAAKRAFAHKVTAAYLRSLST